MQRKVIANDVLIPEIARLVKKGEKVKFVPKGTSMLPFIRGGKDSVVLQWADSFREGDIVLAKIGAIFVLHRIVGIDGDSVILMGDGNLVGTEKCLKSDIMAVAAKIVRNGREIDCHSRKHLAMAWMWKKMMPARRYLLAVYKRIIIVK